MKTKYVAELTLGERGQIVIPKATRVRLGLKPKMKIRMEESDGEMQLSAIRDVSYLDAAFEKWGGKGPSLKDDGFKSVDEYIEAMRGR